MKLDAEFENLPEAFLNAHRTEILIWARELMARGPLLRVCLMRAPGSRDLMAGLLPPDVTLECALYKHPVSGEQKFLIRPAGEFDREMIALYVDRLPSIVAARAAAAEAAKARGGQVDAELEDIPDAFAEAYRAELAAWGQDFGKRGPHIGIVLRPIPGAPVFADSLFAPDEWGQTPMIGVDLVARAERLDERHIRLVIRPDTERDEAIIRRHAEDIARYGEPARRAAVQ